MISPQQALREASTDVYRRQRGPVNFRQLSPQQHGASECREADTTLEGDINYSGIYVHSILPGKVHALFARPGGLEVVNSPVVTIATRDRAGVNSSRRMREKLGLGNGPSMSPKQLKKANEQARSMVSLQSLA